MSGNGPGDAIRDSLARASDARRQGRPGEARILLESVVEAAPGHPVALNSLGLILLETGDPRSAITLFERAATADPKAPPILINLAQAWRAAGEPDREIEALDRALAVDPYLLPALLRKAQVLESQGRMNESVAIYRALLAATPDEQAVPEAVRAALAHGRKVIAGFADSQAQALAGPIEAVRAAHPQADMRRAMAYADNVAGRRRVFQQQPVDGHFPYLPAIEFFDRELFPWFEAIEAATNDIQRDLMSLWDEGDQGFRPYVAFDPSQPVNQWAELNHSPRWSAWFLWKDGVRQDENIARCPATAKALEAVPLLDVPGKSPTVMFSILEPRTRIPPHHGSSNVRTTVHLPLVIPDGCGFRVGAETRPWRLGEAWAFDDTIEHEAWNDSDRPRAILILDVWNPLLSEAERAAVRLVG